jgi:hypothetical protein
VCGFEHTDRDYVCCFFCNSKCASIAKFLSTASRYFLYSFLGTSDSSSRYAQMELLLVQKLCTEITPVITHIPDQCEKGSEHSAVRTRCMCGHIFRVVTRGDEVVKFAAVEHLC